MVLTSPVPEIVEEVADRIIVVKHGEIAAFDTLDGLRAMTECDGSLTDILELLMFRRRPRSCVNISRSCRHDSASDRGLAADVDADGGGLLYLIFQASFTYTEMRWGSPFSRSRWPRRAPHPYGRLRPFVRRLWPLAFHPAYRPQYHEWLRCTPWTSRKALPLADPPGLAGCSDRGSGSRPGLAARGAGGGPLGRGILVAYLLCLGFTHYYTGQKAWAYAVLFGVGFMVWQARELPTFFAVAAVVYGIGYLGLRVCAGGVSMARPPPACSGRWRRSRSSAE